MDLLLNQVHSDTLSSYVNEKFEMKGIGTGDKWIEAELVETKNMSIPTQEIFSLIFSTTKENYLGQGSHIVRHPKIGELTLFLTPIVFGDATGNNYYYEAVFNRLV